MTTARCLNDILKVKIVVGELERLNGFENQNTSYFLFRTKGINIHPEYNDTTRQNNIGLVELPRATPFSSIISNLSLGIPYKIEEFFEIHKLTSMTLNYERYLVSDNQECKESWSFHVDSSLAAFCFGGKNRKKRTPGCRG